MIVLLSRKKLPSLIYGNVMNNVFIIRRKKKKQETFCTYKFFIDFETSYTDYTQFYGFMNIYSFLFISKISKNQSYIYLPQNL